MNVGLNAVGRPTRKVERQKRRGQTIVILGGDETGLAVVRNAASIGLRPVVAARPGDVTLHSRLARSTIIDESAGADALRKLLELADPDGRAALVATNDRWLRFVMAQRPLLDRHFTVLHPDNCVLDICLNKRRFAQWAVVNHIPTPALFELSEASDGASGSLTSLPFQLLVRPEWSNQVPRSRVPKASAVASPDELRALIRLFEEVGSAWVATRSLLGEARQQYSVAVAIRGERSLSFVAEKLRPLPDQCAVGSYVALRRHDRAESLARTVLHSMGFDFGVAEVEIIATRAGELMVIEINPRPWTQFALAFRSGHDFLAFLLGMPVPSVRRREGLSWISFANDLFACFSRSTGLVRHRRIPLSHYLRSLACARVFATFALADPFPALHDIIHLLGITFRRRRGVGRTDPSDAHSAGRS